MLPQISPKSYCHNSGPNRFSSRFSTSRTNGPRLLSQAKAGIHTHLRQQDRTQRLTRRNRDVSSGVVSLPAERFARFGNPAWPGVRTANFATFGSWSEALLKNTESLRDSDALMRVAVPRRRGPAGLRDLFCICRNCGLYALRPGPFRVYETVVVSLPSACSSCC